MHRSKSVPWHHCITTRLLLRDVDTIYAMAEPERERAKRPSRLLNLNKAIVRWTDKGWPGLEGLAEDLAPPQLKAFRRLGIVLEHVYLGLPNDPDRSVGFGRLPDKKAMRKSTGLKDLEIVLNPQFWAEEHAHFYCQHLDKHFIHDRDNYYCQSMSWLQALPDLRLNSLRVVVEAEICDMGRSALRRPFPTIIAKGQVDTIVKWLR